MIRRFATSLFVVAAAASRSPASTCRRRKARRRSRRFCCRRRRSSSATRCATASARRRRCASSRTTPTSIRFPATTYSSSSSTRRPSAHIIATASSSATSIGSDSHHRAGRRRADAAGDGPGHRAPPTMFGLTGKIDTLRVSVGRHHDTTSKSVGSATIAVRLRGAGDTASLGFLVKYALTKAPATIPSSIPGIFFSDDGDEAVGGRHDRRRRREPRTSFVRSWLLADHGCAGGNKMDSAVVIVARVYKGAPVRRIAGSRSSSRSRARSRCHSAASSALVSLRIRRRAVYWRPATSLRARPSMIASGGPRNSAPGTLNQLLLRCRRDVSQARRAAGQAQRPLRADLARHAARARAAHALRTRGARRSRRRPRRDSLGESPRVGDRRLRLPHARRDRRADLSESAERSDRYILRDSGAVAIFVSTAEQAAKIAAIRARVSARCDTSSRSPIRHAGADMTLAALETSGAQVDNEARRTRVSRRARSPFARTTSRRSSTRRAPPASRRA